MERTNEGSGEIKVRVSGLSNGLHEYHFSAEPSEVGLEKNFRHPVEINAEIDKTSRHIYLQADIKTSGFFECDRCLDEFEQPFSTTYRMFYVYSELDGGEYHADELQVISQDTVYIDLTEDIRQTIMLSVPLKLLCKEECKGLCPRCGISLNLAACTCGESISDTRFSGLQDLFNK